MAFYSLHFVFQSVAVTLAIVGYLPRSVFLVLDS